MKMNKRHNIARSITSSFKSKLFIYPALTQIILGVFLLLSVLTISACSVDESASVNDDGQLLTEESVDDSISEDLYVRDPNMTYVQITTNKGEITLELDSDKAPVTVKNFLAYLESGFYDGTIFHRVIPGFMIQGGGFDTNFVQKETKGPIINEADNRLENKRGTIAMARTNDPHSASSQFFINVVDNGPLDYKASVGSQWGYAVFGKVVKGMDVVDSIAAVQTGSRMAFQDVPVENVEIEKVILLEE